MLLMHWGLYSSLSNTMVFSSRNSLLYPITTFKLCYYKSTWRRTKSRNKGGWRSRTYPVYIPSIMECTERGVASVYIVPTDFNPLVKDQSSNKNRRFGRYDNTETGIKMHRAYGSRPWEGYCTTDWNPLLQQDRAYGSVSRKSLSALLHPWKERRMLDCSFLRGCPIVLFPQLYRSTCLNWVLFRNKDFIMISNQLYVGFLS